MEAVKLMKEGKKVRMSSWENMDFIYLNKKNGIGNYGIRDNNEQGFGITYYHMEATYWEIYVDEDNWNLANNSSLTFPEGKTDNLIFLKDVKILIQKVKEEVTKKGISGTLTYPQVNKIIDKRAGDL